MNVYRQISYLHHNNDNNKNYFTIATNNQKIWKQYYFNDVYEIDIDLKQNDIYISQNTFDNKSRKLKNLKQLKAL